MLLGAGKMYAKNKKVISDTLDAYKDGKITKDLALQGVQNIIGEEINRYDTHKGYAIDETDIALKQ